MSPHSAAPPKRRKKKKLKIAINEFLQTDEEKKNLREALRVRHERLSDTLGRAVCVSVSEEAIIRGSRRKDLSLTGRRRFVSSYWDLHVPVSSYCADCGG